MWIKLVFGSIDVDFYSWSLIVLMLWWHGLLFMNVYWFNGLLINGLFVVIKCYHDVHVAWSETEMTLYSIRKAWIDIEFGFDRKDIWIQWGEPIHSLALVHKKGEFNLTST